MLIPARNRDTIIVSKMLRYRAINTSRAAVIEKELFMSSVRFLEDKTV